MSRVIEELGATTTTIVALGGAAGASLETMLKAELSDLSVFSINGETRQSLSVTATESNEQYRFVMPGPNWDSEVVEGALKTIKDRTPSGALVVFSGSLPPGVPHDFPERLSYALDDCDLIFDLSGDTLEMFASSEANALILRMDLGEAETLYGEPLRSTQDTSSFGRSLIEKRAAQNIVIARGAEGSVLVNPEGSWLVKAADVPVNSKVGAGDSFVGAMVYALAKGQSMQEALQLGAAAASATVTTPATELCSRTMIYDLLPDCPITEITD